MKTLKGLKIFLVWAVFAGVLCGAWFGWYHVEREQMPVRTEIEQAVQVQVQFMVIVRLGGAGAGGSEVAQITCSCSSSQQFISLVEEGEKIYPYVLVEMKPVKGNVHSILESGIVAVDKVYSTKIRDGSVFLQYRDTHQMEGFWVEEYNQKMIDLRKDNKCNVAIFTILFALFGGVGAGKATAIIAKKK